MKNEKYTLRIQRNTMHPDGTLESRWQEYVVEALKTATVLSVLEDVKGEQDGSLTFRQSCRSAICGSCAMKIGDRTRLACKTHIGAVVDGDNKVSIAAQQNQPILKDLVVDISHFFDKIHQIKPYLQEGPESRSFVR